MDLRKKLLLTVVVGGILTLLGAIALVLQSTKVIDITQYFPSLHPGQPTAAAEKPTEVSVAQGTAETAAATTEEPGSSKGRHTDTGSGKGDRNKAAVPTETDLGSIGTVVDTLSESPTGNPGSIRTTVVKLSDSAMEWAQPGRYPKIGDRIGITLPPDGKRFVIQVVYFRERSDGSGLDLYGRLEDLGSTVLMMTVGNKFNLRITDQAAKRIYYVSYMAESGDYVIEEWDMNQQPTAIPSDHQYPAPR